MSNVGLYTITVLIWGSTWLAIKFQLGVVPPELSISYRFAIAAVLLFIYSFIRRLPMRFSLRTQAFIVLQALLLFSTNYVLVYLAEGYLTSGLVAITFSTIILTNVIFGAIFLRNPIRPRVILGAVLGFVGLALVFWPELKGFDFSTERALGLGLAFVATILASLGNIVSARNQRNEIPIVQSNAYGMAYGALITLLFAVLRGAKLTFDPTVGYVASLVFLAIFGSVIAFGAYLTLLGRIGPDRSAYVTVLFPIVALGLSTAFESLKWNGLAMIGVVFVVLGNVVALTKIRWESFWFKPKRITDLS